MTKNKTEKHTVFGDIVPREELRKNILGLFDELNTEDFHTLYHLLWTMTAKELVIKCKEDTEKILKRKIKQEVE